MKYKNAATHLPDFRSTLICNLLPLDRKSDGELKGEISVDEEISSNVLSVTHRTVRPKGHVPCYKSADYLNSDIGSVSASVAYQKEPIFCFIHQPSHLINDRQMGLN